MVRVAVTLEPLKAHLDHYEIMLASNLLQGVQAVYRGLGQYDPHQTKAVVRRLVGQYKKCRYILESDLIHLQRANGRTLDYMLHITSNLPEKGFLSIFNPTPDEISQQIRLPLYYTGLATVVNISCQDQPSVIYPQIDILHRLAGNSSSSGILIPGLSSVKPTPSGTNGLILQRHIGQ